MMHRFLAALGLAATLLLGLGLLSACGPRPADPAQLRVAVAANFLPTLKQLAEGYNQAHAEQPIRVKTMVGSTGLLYAQIEVGAPFDLFFAADLERPERLAAGDKTLGPAQVYALGRLALWAPEANFKTPRKRLAEGEYKRLAVANSAVSPYGAAAEQVLKKLALWENIQPRLIRGENVAQAYQYLDSGRAELGFVALSQTRQQAEPMSAEALWLVPAKMHRPLQQAAVVLAGERQSLAEAFLGFCLGKEGRAIIQAAGYDLPEQQY